MDDKSMYENASRVIGALMELRQIERSAAYERLGVSKQTFSDKMTAKRRWTLQEVDQLSKLFGVSAGLFFEPADALRLTSASNPPTPQYAVSRGHKPAHDRVPAMALTAA